MRYANEVPFYLGSLGMRQYECIAYTTRPLSISLPGISVTGHLKASSLMGEGGGEGRELRPPGLPGDSFGLRRLAGTAPLSGLI